MNSILMVQAKNLWLSESELVPNSGPLGPRSSLPTASQAPRRASRAFSKIVLLRSMPKEPTAAPLETLPKLPCSDFSEC